MTKAVRGVFSLAAMLALGLVLGYAGTSLLASPGSGAGTMMGPGSTSMGNEADQGRHQVQMGPGGGMMTCSGGMMGGGMMGMMQGMMGGGMMGMMGGMMGMMKPENMPKFVLKHELRFHGHDSKNLDTVVDHAYQALKAANKEWSEIPTPSKSELKRTLEQMKAKRGALAALMQWFMKNHEMGGMMMGPGMMGGQGMMGGPGMGGPGMHQSSGSR